MNYIEYGQKNSKVIILLHGGGLSWWNYREVAENLQENYHVILPVLDGHAGSDRPFTTIEDNADEIIEFIGEKFDGSVLMIGGLSLGAQILLEILSKCPNICQHAMVESALIIPSKLTCSMIKPAFGSSYRLIQKKWFSRLQFKYLRLKKELFEEYYRDTCAITKKDMIAFLEENAMFTVRETIKENEAKIHIFVGTKEQLSMRKSAKELHNMLHGSTIQELPGLYHGEFSINCAKEYAEKINEIIEVICEKGKTT